MGEKYAMKKLCFVALLFIPFNVLAQTIDYSKPSIVIKGDKAYPTYPGTEARDYSKPGYVIDSSGILRPTHLGTNSIDRLKPGIMIKGDKAYLTHLGTESPDYSKPGYVKDINGVLRPLSKN